MNLPNKPLSNVDIESFVKWNKIPYFRGVFSCDVLPKKIHKNESGVINLDKNIGQGTHWVAYKKIGNVVKYFDSFGNLQPPQEAVQYFTSNGPCRIFYNHERFQKFNTFNCGHLCLTFLQKNK
jgi:hypothetical protein